MTNATDATLGLRGLSTADLDAVCAVLRASDVAVLGHPDFTPEEVAADLANPDLHAYGMEAGGRLVAYAWVSRQGDSDKVEIDAYVHPEHDDSTLGPALVAFLERRAAELVKAAGHDCALLDLGVYREDDRTRSWLTPRGFETGTTFVRMRIDFDGEYAAQPWPDGLVVRESDSDEDLRTAHDVFERSFTEHYGHVPATDDAWLRRLTERGEDWSRLWLAELDGVAVGMLVGTRQFEPDEDAGYVRTLATLPEARGKGAGKALLREYFRVSSRAGRRAVYLHVDVANVTGALRLYESVGMRPFLTIDAWKKRVPVAG